MEVCVVKKGSPQSMQNAVQVTNISPTANEKTVSDFFSFCGKITQLYLHKYVVSVYVFTFREEGQETSSAVVQFESESAAKTALLLTNALIVDRPINVVPYAPTAEQLRDESEPTPPGTPMAKEKITQRNFNGVPDEERSKTSVVASLLASGYVLGSDILNKAQQYDEENNISLKFKVGIEQLKVKAHELDVQYGLSERAASMKSSAAETANKLDQDYHISEKAASAANTVKSAAYQVKSCPVCSLKAAENPSVKSGVETVRSGWNSLASAVEGVYKDYYEQTTHAIQEKQKEKGIAPQAKEMTTDSEQKTEKKEQETPAESKEEKSGDAQPH